MKCTITIHHEPILEADEVIIEAIAMRYGFRLESKTITSVEGKDIDLPNFPTLETEANIDQCLANKAFYTLIGIQYDIEDWLIETLEADGWNDIVRRVDINSNEIFDVTYKGNEVILDGDSGRALRVTKTLFQREFGRGGCLVKVVEDTTSCDVCGGWVQDGETICENCE